MLFQYGITELVFFLPPICCQPPPPLGCPWPAAAIPGWPQPPLGRPQPPLARRPIHLSLYSQPSAAISVSAVFPLCAGLAAVAASSHTTGSAASSPFRPDPPSPDPPVRPLPPLSSLLAAWVAPLCAGLLPRVPVGCRPSLRPRCVGPAAPRRAAACSATPTRRPELPRGRDPSPATAR